MKLFKKLLSSVAVAGLISAPALAYKEPITTQQNYYVTPEQFGSVIGESDSGPAITAAINYACSSTTHPKQIIFSARIYTLNSFITQTCTLDWQGQGWSDNGPTYGGTWFAITSGLIGSTPIISLNYNGAGSQFSNFGVTEVQPTPSGASWAPNNYGYFIKSDMTSNPLLSTGSLFVNNIMLWGVTNGIYSYSSGRLTVNGLWGQVFTSMLYIDKAYDVVRLDNIDQFPFYSMDPRVYAYQQANLDTVSSYRVDTPQYGKIFTIFARSGLRVGLSSTSGGLSGGSTTKSLTDRLSCDATVKCLWVDNTVDYSQVLQPQFVGELDSYSQQYPAGVGSISGTSLTFTNLVAGTFVIGDVLNVYGGAYGVTTITGGTYPNFTVSPSATVASGSLLYSSSSSIAMTGSAAILIDGAAQIFVDQMYYGGFADTVIRETNNTYASTLEIGQAFFDYNISNSTVSWLTTPVMSTSVHDQLYVGMQPIEQDQGGKTIYHVNPASTYSVVTLPQTTIYSAGN